MMLSRDMHWEQIHILFSGQTDKSLEQRVGHLPCLLTSVTKQVAVWDNIKKMHLFCKTVATQFKVHGAERGASNDHLGLRTDVQGRHY